MSATSQRSGPSTNAAISGRAKPGAAVRSARVGRLVSPLAWLPSPATGSSVADASDSAARPPGHARPAGEPAAKAAIPAAPQCQDGSAARAGVPPGRRLSYQNGAAAGRLRAPARSAASADRAAARFASGSMPARARSSSTQPIPAAPLSSPTCTGEAGVARQLVPGAVRGGDAPQPDGLRARATPVGGGRRLLRAARRLTQAMPGGYRARSPTRHARVVAGERPAEPARGVGDRPGRSPIRAAGVAVARSTRA